MQGWLQPCLVSFRGWELTQIGKRFGLFNCFFLFVGYWFEWGSDDGWLWLGISIMLMQSAISLSEPLHWQLLDNLCEALLLLVITLSFSELLSLPMIIHTSVHSLHTTTKHTNPSWSSIFLLLFWNITRQWWYFMQLIQTLWAKKRRVLERRLCVCGSFLRCL